MLQTEVIAVSDKQLLMCSCYKEQTDTDVIGFQAVLEWCFIYV